MSDFEAIDRQLTDQVALVTGGGRGIGREIALKFAKAGAKVAVVARTREQLDETVAQIDQNGGQAISFAQDVTNQSAVEQIVKEINRQWGPIDILVNNAGMGGTETLLWETNAADWWRVVEVNLRGPFLCAHAVLPGMLERRSGKIINVTSGAGAYPFALNSAYTVSKAALFRLTDDIAEMTRDRGVTVFAISPGLVRTAMTRDMNMFKDVPEEEWLPIEKAGELCVFLASGKADRLSGRYLTVRDDLDELLQRADEIVENDLYVLRLRK